MKGQLFKSQNLLWNKNSDPGYKINEFIYLNLKFGSSKPCWLIKVEQINKDDICSYFGIFLKS